jgi:hypothetical protein
MSRFHSHFPCKRVVPEPVDPVTPASTTHLSRLQARDACPLEGATP